MLCFWFLVGCNQQSHKGIDYHKLENSLDVFQQNNFRFPENTKELLMFMRENNLDSIYLDNIDLEGIRELTMFTVNDTFYVKNNGALVFEKKSVNPCAIIIGDEMVFLNKVFIYGEKNYALLNQDELAKKTRKILFGHYMRNGGTNFDLDTVDFKLMEFDGNNLIDLCKNSKSTSHSHLKYLLKELLAKADSNYSIRFTLAT